MPTRPAAVVLIAVLTAALSPRPIIRAQARILPALGSASSVVTAATEPRRDSGSGHALAADMAGGRRTRGFIRHRIVHFTFDDGPRASTTRRLLDQLDAYDIKATFFVVGRQLEGRRHAPERAVLREMVRRGHTVGSHTFDHSDLTTLTDAQINLQISRTEAAFERTLGGRPHLFRPPYGARDRHIDELLARRSYTEMLWNISSRDTVTRDPDAMLEGFRAQLDRLQRHPRGPGGIILVHDSHAHSVDAFPRMVEELRARNCALLDQDGEELWDIADDPRIFFQARRGTRDRMARPVQLDDETLLARQSIVRIRALEYCRTEA